MIYGVTAAGRFIHHYTTAENARLIIEKLRLRMGRLLKTNDPKENKDWRFWLAGTEGNLLHYSADEMSAQFSHALKKLVRVACFCSDSSPLCGDPIQDIGRRGFGKPRMWQQYGDEHKGVCFVFDRARFAKQIMNGTMGQCTIYGGEVMYADRSFVTDFDQRAYGIDIDCLTRVGLDRYVARHAHTFRQRLFFEKMTDWQGEKEFRWIVLSREEKDLFVDLSSSLTGVVFGERTEAIASMLSQLPLDVSDCPAQMDQRLSLV